jgi:hypothetical protein
MWLVRLCVLVLWIVSASANIQDSEDTFDTTVECSLGETQVDSLIFDDANQIYRRPSAEYSNVNSGTVSVKECWCARLLRITPEYCLAEFDTCQVQGELGAVLCFSNEARINAVRGMWPFCLFWFVTLFYLCIASQPGRRARNYVIGKAMNGVDVIQSRLATTTTTTTTTTTSPEATRTNQTPIQEENSISEDGTTIPSNSVESALVSHATDEEAPTASRTDAAMPTNPTNASTDSIPVNYPPEFGSRSNYLHLLRELHRIQRYEPDQMVRLWHSAWNREHRQLRQQGDQESAVAVSGWNTGRTIKLSLKTKRFEGSEENRDDAHEEKDDDEYSLEEGRKEKTCAICLSEIENGDIVGDIPCHHVFHKDCLKSWLQRCNRCPLCQQEGIASRSRPPVYQPETDTRSLNFDHTR